MIIMLIQPSFARSRRGRLRTKEAFVSSSESFIAKTVPLMPLFLAPKTALHSIIGTNTTTTEKARISAREGFFRCGGNFPRSLCAIV